MASLKYLRGSFQQMTSVYLKIPLLQRPFILKQKVTGLRTFFQKIPNSLELMTTGFPPGFPVAQSNDYANQSTNQAAQSTAHAGRPSTSASQLGTGNPQSGSYAYNYTGQSSRLASQPPTSASQLWVDNSQSGTYERSHNTRPTHNQQESFETSRGDHDHNKKDRRRRRR